MWLDNNSKVQNVSSTTDRAMNSSHYLCIAWCWTLNGVDYDVRKFADFSCMCGVESNFDAIISDDLINKSI